MKNELNVGLLWHSDNSGNLGVGALTVGNMALAERAARKAGVGLAFHLFKSGDAGTPYVTDGIVSRHAITGKYTINPSGCWRDIRRLDIVLDIAAGDSFADIYPTKRFLYQAATKLMAIRGGTPLVLSPQTIGPFNKRPHRFVASRILRRAEAVFARDPMSFALVGKLAPEAHAYETIDVAFALPFTPQEKAAKPRFGINVSGLLYSGGYSGKNEFGMDVDFRQYVHGLIEALSVRDDVEIVLVKHVQAPHMPRDDDGAAAASIRQHYPGVTNGPDFASPSDAKSFVSGLDFLVAGRMHASIAGFSSGVPVVPVSYSRKFEGLYGSLGYKWLVPRQGMSTADAIAFTLDAYDKRATLAADVASGNERTARLLDVYVDRLADIFTRIAGQVAKS